MQDWDRMVMILIGGGVAVYTCIPGWRFWRQQQTRAAIGTFLLAVATVALPFALVAFGQ